MTPKIFTVHVFKMVENLRRLEVHYVAATSSKEAEACIKERDSAHLGGQCFITTDKFEAEHSNGCKLYVTRYRSDDAISDSEFASWVRVMTNDRYVDGDLQPATFRRMHVHGARVSRKAAAEALAA